MIVKNEAHIIADTLAHLWNYIQFDYWLISDTGSTDKTKEIVKDFFKKKGVPGELQEVPWRDFGYNRTKAFEGAYGKTDYAFVWDADDEISGNFKMPTDLTADAYKFLFGNAEGMRYSRGQLFNNRKRWCYRGVLHEYADCLEKAGPMVDVNGDYFFISGRRGDRSKDPHKYLKDALVLEKAAEKALEEKDPLYNRYIFYCAQSYNSCNMKEKAIEFYKKALTLQLWIQEKYVSCMEIFDKYDELGKPEEGLYYLVESLKYDNTRVECFLRLIKHYCIKGPVEVAYGYYTVIQNFYENHYDGSKLGEKLFAKRGEYDFFLPYYMIIVSERTKNMKTCIKMYENIFKYKYIYVGEWWVRNIFHNMQFCINDIPMNMEFLEDCLSYLKIMKGRGIKLEPSQQNVVCKLLDHFKPLLGSAPPKPPTLTSKTSARVMLTMTSCKRFDLFEKTVNSLLRTWTDIEKVDYFYCVDDNSSQRDRTKMQKAFPFFNFYMKRSSERGHRASMNLIYDKIKELKPTFWIHMEDDWLFFEKDDYVQKSINFLNKYEKKGIHQILYNRNYAETYDGWDINGGEVLEPGFLLHVKADNIPGRNCAYWPHYSFRPSMTRTSVIMELGNYDSPNTFFERDYADRYFAKDYKSGFFDTVCSLHTGKLTSDKKGTNAYTLNQTGQFNEPGAKKQQNTFVVNLLRRTDRKEAIEETFEKAGIAEADYEFFEAVDGRDLIMTDEINTLFYGNDFGTRKGFLGCALSHYNLWKQLVASESEYYTIFEDDITLCEGFKARWESAKKTLKAADMVFLGYTSRDTSLRTLATSVPIVNLDMERYIGGFFGYIITKAGAKKMVDYITDAGIKHGIDFLVKIVPDLRCKSLQPHIVQTEWVSSQQSNVDTDIQKDYSSIVLAGPAVDTNDWVFYEGVDSGGDDIRSSGKKAINEIMAEATAEKHCIAFNTLGFLKSTVKQPFSKTPYIFGPGTGIFIRKSVTRGWISPVLAGGIGNLLFKTAAAISLAEKLQREVVFYEPAVQSGDVNMINRLYALFPKIQRVKEVVEIQTVDEVKDDQYNYAPFSNISLTHNIVLGGYRQNIKYTPESGVRIKLGGEDLYSAYGLSMADDKMRSWFIHVRLGDYRFHSFLNHINMETYYKLVLDKVPSDANVILFSDEPDRAAEILKPYFNREFRICKETDEIVSLGLMSQCWGGAIVPNSTFSWWGAYFARQASTEPASYLAYYPKYWTTTSADYKNNCVPSWGTAINNVRPGIKPVEEWIFYEGMDSGSADIKKADKIDPNEIMIEASANPKCVAFNTLGYLKSRVKFPLIKSPWLKAPHGIYVKKSYVPTIRVKMLCNWCSSEELCKEWLKMTHGAYKWNDIEITWTDEDIDYYVIINKPKAGDTYVPEKSIVYHMEPWCADPAQNWGIKSWGQWAKPDPRSFMQIRSHDKFVNPVFWQLNLTFNQLQTMTIKKPAEYHNIVSSICSSKYYDPGHKKRIDFLHYLESKGLALHIYNEDNQRGFKSYMGKARPSIDKEEGIIHYKYYFMCENNVEHNFVTEKLWEPILCESLCFYWGCPNISDIIDPRAYVQLDMDDFESAYNTMNAAIQTNLWEERLPYIKEAKKKILAQSFFPTLEKVLKPKAVCFIHSCHLASAGTEKLDLILESVLKVKELESITINNIGLKLDDAKYTAMDPRIRVLHSSDDSQLFELPTLRLIHEFSIDNPNTKVLYAHTKGISYAKDDSRYLPGLDWIKFMLHFLCEKSDECLVLLNNRDVLGCNFSDSPKPHFSGNFWWATTKYLKTLSASSLTDKMSAEWWLYSRPTPPVKNELWNSGKNHFHECYPRHAYTKDTLDPTQVEYVSLYNEDGKSGCCNQIMSLVSAIIYAYNTNKKTLLVGDFLTDITNGKKISSSTVFDFPSMNTTLLKYGVQLFDAKTTDPAAGVEFNWHFYWINPSLKDQFDEVTKHIRFNKKYYDLAKTSLFTLGSNFNTIHVRDEADAINFWSRQNEMSPPDFKAKLENIYIEHIKNAFKKEDMILVLTSNLNSKVITFMKQHGYKYVINKKVLAGREENAIVDLISASNTNGSFIGNFNNELLRGSSFSYTIQNLIKGSFTYISVDLDKL